MTDSHDGYGSLVVAKHGGVGFVAVRSARCDVSSRPIRVEGVGDALERALDFLEEQHCQGDTSPSPSSKMQKRLSGRDGAAAVMDIQVSNSDLKLL